MFAILKMLLESSLTLCRFLTQFATIFVPLAKNSTKAAATDWQSAVRVSKNCVQSKGSNV